MKQRISLSVVWIFVDVKINSLLCSYLFYRVILVKNVKHNNNYQSPRITDFRFYLSSAGCGYTIMDKKKLHFSLRR